MSKGGRKERRKRLEKRDGMGGTEGLIKTNSDGWWMAKRTKWGSINSKTGEQRQVGQ
jgi:hypothetical protein